jgi:hypothetical protein
MPATVAGHASIFLLLFETANEDHVGCRVLGSSTAWRPEAGLAEEFGFSFFFLAIQNII